MRIYAATLSLVLLATISLVGCGHYTCGTTFGNGSCTSGGGSGGGVTGGGGGTFLFQADAGGIQGETLDVANQTMKITGTGTVGTAVPGSWMAIAKQYLYTGYPGVADIYGWTINGDGTLTAVTGMAPFSASYLGGNTNTGLQAMITNPAGTLLFMADQTSDQVHVYQIASGALTELTSSLLSLPSGFKPFNLAMDGQGKYLFVNNIVGAVTTQVAVYSLSSSNTLTAVQNSPFASSEQQMQGESSGKFMVGATAGNSTGDEHLYVVNISGLQSGTFTEMSTSMPTGFAPTSVSVQPSSGGTLVYAFNYNGVSSGAVGYTIDLTSGALTAVSGSPFSISASSGQFDQNGKYMFVVESASGANTTVLDAYDVSASPTLTTPIASVGWASNAWQAYDAP